jgi:hypothetical protein
VVWKHALMESLGRMKEQWAGPMTDRVCLVVLVTTLGVTALQVVARLVG